MTSTYCIQFDILLIYTYPNRCKSRIDLTVFPAEEFKPLISRPELITYLNLQNGNLTCREELMP